MTREEALDKLCHSYSGYFDVVRHEEPKGHLVAEAGLHIHSEKYVLVKAAKLWEADNNEYVYIFSVPVLTKEIFEQCREQARVDGLQRIEPGPNHMCSYITAIFLCDTCEPDALRALRRAGVPCEMHIFGAGQHGLSLCNDQVYDAEQPSMHAECACWIDMAARWLKGL